MADKITKEDILDKEFIQALNDISNAIQRIVRANEVLKKHGLDITEYLKPNSPKLDSIEFSKLVRELPSYACDENIKNT